MVEIADPVKVVVPGLGGSGPGHWQSLWADGRPGWRRVEQGDWESPAIEAWLAGLEEAVRGAGGPVLLVAHSLGSMLVAHWARRGSIHRVAGAMLVAPADVERPGFPAAVRGFAPAPFEPLPFPSWVVASTDDPYCTFERARCFAAAWGAGFRSVGASGHVNVASGNGPWPAGERLLAEVLAAVASQPRSSDVSTSAA